MKYYEPFKASKRKRRSIQGVVAALLIAVGIFAWAAVSGQKVDTKENNKQPQTPSYRQDIPSYDYTEPEIEDDTDVNNTVEDIPYEEEEPAVNEEPLQAPIMPLEGEITKNFSNTALQYSATFDDLRLHTGIDIAAEINTTVKSVAAGIVLSTDESAMLGKTVTIDHGNGIIMKYCGLETISTQNGKTVTMGEPIGTVGAVPSECNEKSHLHLEMTLNGEPCSPLDYIGKIPE